MLNCQAYQISATLFLRLPPGCWDKTLLMNFLFQKIKRHRCFYLQQRQKYIFTGLASTLKRTYFSSNIYLFWLCSSETNRLPDTSPTEMVLLSGIEICCLYPWQATSKSQHRWRKRTLYTAEKDIGRPLVKRVHGF